VGKTVTTEFAFFEPGPTRNPWDLTRTPGGSSSGSAAAVAAGFADLAVGSQTQGSVIRPAAFCGIVGFKPTHGVLSTDGVLHVAPTLDTVGLFGADVATVAAAFAVLTGQPQRTFERPPRLAVARTADLADASATATERFEADVAAIVGIGAQLLERRFPPDLEHVRDLVLTIQNAEAAHTVGPMIDGHDDLVSDRVRRLVAEGRAIRPSKHSEALRHRARLIERWQSWAGDVDATLTIPAGGEAPPIAEGGTGDPRWCFRWTLLGAPAITIPTGLGPNGLPLGLQLVGVPGGDAELLATAAWLEARISGVGRPDMERRPRKNAGAVR
jgi:amidase